MDKSKKTQKRDGLVMEDVMGNGCIWEGIYMMNAFRVSQSLFCQVLNAVSECAKKKIFNGEIIFHLKRILKRLRYYK